MIRRASIVLVLLVASGCNTFFGSSPEFLDNRDTGVSDAEDAPTADASDTSDVVPGDAGDADAGQAVPILWEVTVLESTNPILPKLSLTGTQATAQFDPEFGVAYVESSGSSERRGRATMRRISLPDMALSAPRAGSQGDEQWDVATGVDSMGRLVWGAVQPCQADIVARVFYRPNTDWQTVPITVPCDGGGPNLAQVAITGGMEMFSGALGGVPSWVWTEAGTSPTISAIHEDFSPVTAGDGDQVLVSLDSVQLDQNFIRPSGGPLVLLRQTGTNTDAVVWDALQRSNPNLAPVVLARDMSQGGDIIWIEDNEYLLVSYGGDLLEIGGLRCTSGAALQCQLPSTDVAYGAPDVEALRAAAFHGGFVVGTLARTSDAQVITFRVFEVTGSGDSIDMEVVETATISIDGAEPESFDVGATFVDGDLFVAAGVVRQQSTRNAVEVHGYQYPGYLSERF